MPLEPVIGERGRRGSLLGPLPDTAPATSIAAVGRLLAYARRETMELRRDPIRLAFALFGPLLLMIAMGYGISFDVERISYAALDWDRSPESRAYLDHFAASQYFQTERPIIDAADLSRRLRAGRLTVAIEIPPGFGRDLKRDRRPELYGEWLK